MIQIVPAKLGKLREEEYRGTMQLADPDQCVLGYALAPILLASIVSLLVHNLFVRIPVSLACWAWSVWGELYFPFRARAG